MAEPAAMPAPAAALSTSAVLSQLEKVLQSRAFGRCERLRRLLRYLVDQTLQCPDARLDQPSIRAAVFGQKESAAAAANPLVRVEAHRLRLQLARYYAGEGRQDRIEIAVPPPGYRPVFRDRCLLRAAQSSSVSRSILVRPFLNLAGSAKSERFIAGLRTELLCAVAELRGLRTLTIHGRGIREMLAGSAVDAELEGSVRAHGRNLRVHAQLTSRADGALLWSQMFERSTADSVVQQELAHSICRSIAAILGVKNGTGPGLEGAAHRLYLSGGYLCEQRTRASLHRSIECFKRAARLAVHHPLPYAGMVQAYALLAIYGGCPAAEVLPAAAAVAQRCQAWGPESPDGHLSLAIAAACADWDLARAEQEFLLAIGSDPGNVHARQFYTCCCLLPMARFAEAIAQMRRAVELDPLSLTAQNALGWTLHFAGQADSALEQLQQTLDLQPDFYLTHWSLGLLYERLGRPGPAIAAFLQAYRLSGDMPLVFGALGHSYGRFGMPQKAEALLERLRQLAQQGWATALDSAWVHLGLGDGRSGIEWLEKAAGERSTGLLWLAIDPRARTLHREPRFHDLLQRLGLPPVRG